MPLVWRASPLQPEVVFVLSPYASAIGKWKAMPTWLAGRRYTRGDYVRHLPALADTRGPGAFAPVS